MLIDAEILKYFTTTFCENERGVKVVIDENKTIVVGTNYYANLVNVKSYKSLIGKNSNEVNHSSIIQSGDEFLRQNNKVINTMSRLNAIDIHTYTSGVKFLHTCKNPLQDKQGNKSIYISCVELDSYKRLFNVISKDLLRFSYKNSPLSISLEIIDQYDKLNLTRRQSECFYYLLRGYSNSDIANILYISKRTSESHIKDIRDKLGIKSQYDIVEYGLMFNLLHYIPRSLLAKYLP